MLSRRYLRRSFLVILILPIVLLFSLALYQNRHVIFSENSSDHHHPDTHDSYLSHDTLPNHNLRYDFHSKPLITENPIQSIRKIPQTSQNFQPNDNRPMQNFDFIQQNQTSILPVIKTANLDRFVHLDLKGAAPKLAYLEKLFPYLKKLGANGLLIEYEDMFPYTGRLRILRHGLAYSKADIEQILQLAEKNHLQVMPLLQVYGHLEYVLKLKEFMHLREDVRYPQVITPCLEESYQLLFEMIDQMLILHPSIPYLHIGCDEVYYRLVHPQCSNLQIRDDVELFIRHVTRVAKYIKSKRTTVKLFIWHDMISQLVNSGSNNITELIELVVPMVWAYVDDVKPWFDDTVWMKFAMFPEVWVASSFKGSSGETTTMNYIGHHQRNQQTWLETMYSAFQKYKVNFTGIAITGWSRYDHMLPLCEFLPSAIPSLVYTLQTIVHGHITQQLNETISLTILGCTQMPLWERSPIATYLSCTFPGHEMYEMMYKYDSLMREYDETMAFVRLFITDIHLRQNFIHYKRTEECLERLFPLESSMIRFTDVFQNACSIFFTADIGPEWLQTYFMRSLKEVQKRLNFVERTLKSQSSWSQRPMSNNISRIVVKKRNATYSNILRNV
ncbi:hypothetical protein I4U23_006839 [Adineta vaga]|nr:hypothetical protein I4U23_006839 [Adineta vaga]